MGGCNNGSVSGQNYSDFISEVIQSQTDYRSRSTDLNFINRLIWEAQVYLSLSNARILEQYPQLSARKFGEIPLD